MPIDPTGTTPGLALQAQPDPNVVNMKCRNRKCKSITATQIKVPSQQRVYRCTKCGHTWSIVVGGNIDI